MRLTHTQVVRFCNAHVGCVDGFPLALANFCYDLGREDEREGVPQTEPAKWPDLSPEGKAARAKSV